MLEVFYINKYTYPTYKYINIHILQVEKLYSLQYNTLNKLSRYFLFQFKCFCTEIIIENACKIPGSIRCTTYHDPIYKRKTIYTYIHSSDKGKHIYG